MALELETSDLDVQCDARPGVALIGWKWGLHVLACLLPLAGCRSEAPEVPTSESSIAALERARNKADAGPESHRFVAVSHEFAVEADERELTQALESIEEFCRTIRCDVVASSIRQRTSDSPPGASLSLRVAPEQLPRLIEQIEAVGSILEHKTESTDKTATVIDVDAKIKNLTEFRDRMRKMLSASNAGVKDIVEVERELSKVQSELDSIQTTRKALANETEKVFVSIAFSVRKSMTETGTLAPIVTAWYSIGHVLAGSIAAAIYFVVAIAPWLVLFIPAVWLCRKAIRKLRSKRGST
jgi:hypothetical protein